MSHWPEYMSTASDEAILVYIREHKKYVPEAVEAAISELEKRGKPLTKDEVHSIKANVEQIQQQHKAMEMETLGVDNNVVSDIDAPDLYSPKAIYGFTFAFGALFGGILFCLNLSRINRTNYIIPVLLGSVAYSALQIYIGTVTKGFGNIGFLTSILAGLIYQYMLWPKVSGGNVKYRKRAIIYPLMMGVVLAAIFLVAVFQFS